MTVTVPVDKNVPLPAVAEVVAPLDVECGEARTVAELNAAFDAARAGAPAIAGADRLDAG